MEKNHLKWEEEWTLTPSLRKRLSLFFEEEGIPIAKESLDKLLGLIEDEIDKRVYKKLILINSKRKRKR